jgi:aspartate racemase
LFGVLATTKIDNLHFTGVQMKSNSTKTAGVLGGMGPDATVDFMAKVVALTPAGRDQDHVRMIVDHNPKIPSRSDAILGKGADPGPVMAAMAAGLETAGADFLVMPCNTAHVFRESIEAVTNIPLISIIDLTVAACDQFEKVGVLATDGCLECGIYQNALAGKNLEAVIPDEDDLVELMRLIDLIKLGDRSDEISQQLRHIAEGLIDNGAQAIVAGCTEIPLVLRESMLDVPLISSTDVLAQATVSIARGETELLT